ncbi:MAG: cyclase family protein [Candidatus Bathyarchaeota archaeon]|nr:cyclase family protein [Candidatus Bathyarchaeota archaeon]
MRFVELNHPIEDGMAMYPGLPAPRIGTFLGREESRPHYEGKAEFLVGEVEMVGSTGTYLDAPFHRHPGGADLSQIPLEGIAGLPGIVVDVDTSADRSITIERSEVDLRGRAVLVMTGWDERWGTDGYWDLGPHLSEATVDLLIRSGARLVGVDFWNIDDVLDPSRPAHTRLLGSNVLIVENLCNLSDLPTKGFRFYAVPPRIVQGASFTVRAFAEIDE